VNASDADLSPAPRLRRAAQYLVALRQPGPRPVSLPAILAPQNEAEAYQLQSDTAHALGQIPGGWKVAMNDAHSGSCAPVFASDLHRSSARVSSPISERLGIEPEIAFSLGCDLPPLPDGQLYRLEQVIEAIDAAHAALEIVISRFQSADGAPALDRLADNLSNGGLVVGTPCHDWRRLELATLPLRYLLQANQGAAIVHEARGGHPLGDPLLPLLWLVNHRSARGVSMRCGDIITTGSCAGLRYVERGAHVLAQFEGLGSAELYS
jgi:2-keto-4-pentenoate hydratase